MLIPQVCDMDDDRLKQEWARGDSGIFGLAVPEMRGKTGTDGNELSCLLLESAPSSALDIMANPFRIALSDPHLASRPRYLVGGQAGAASGDVKLYEWHRSVRRAPTGLVQ